MLKEPLTFYEFTLLCPDVVYTYPEDGSVIIESQRMIGHLPASCIIKKKETKAHPWAPLLVLRPWDKYILEKDKETFETPWYDYIIPIGCVRLKTEEEREQSKDYFEKRLIAIEKELNL